MKIYLATDHAGFSLKEEVKAFLEDTSHGLLKEPVEVYDCGALTYEDGDDYPAYMALLSLEGQDKGRLLLLIVSVMFVLLSTLEVISSL